MQFIIHADDFGKNESVTRAIDDVMKCGLCNETSLMVNMHYSDDAVSIARRNGYADKVGLHVNLTEGTPLTDRIRRCPRFCNQDGTFNKKFHMKSCSRFLLSLEERKAVSEELSAQLDKFSRYGGLMMRIDSHHHIHTDWSVYHLLKPLALAKSFKSMRISADLHKVRIDKEFYKRLYNRDVRRHFDTTDHFDGANNAGLFCGSGTVEVMVHPMFVDGILCDACIPYEKSIRKLHGSLEQK